MGPNSNSASNTTAQHRQETRARLSLVPKEQPHRKKNFLNAGIAALLSQITRGSLIVSVDSGAEERFGDPLDPDPIFWKIHDPRAVERIMTGGSLALGETYVQGLWDVDGDRLTEFIGILLLNKLEARITVSLNTRLRLAVHHLLNNPVRPSAAKRCIQKHYDLGNNFFRLMLDGTMAYSCGYATAESNTLAEMQQQKYVRSAGKLGLHRGGRLLDIGCGWGGMLLHTAQHYPAVTGLGISLSKEQVPFVQQLLAQSGGASRFKAELCDYRYVEGCFDFIVSIGMFEHVGAESYATFMKRVSGLLAPDGVGLLHTIGVTEVPQARPDAWTNTYIFPGSRLPRLEESISELQRARLVPAHVENWKLNYALTLRHWKRNIDAHRAEVLALGKGFDQRFLRIWNYYLQSCEASFRYGKLQLYQILFCHEGRWPFGTSWEFK